MPTNLTDADLAAIEARLADVQTNISDCGEYTGAVRGVAAADYAADVSRLLAGVREARAERDAAVETDDPGIVVGPTSTRTIRVVDAALLEQAIRERDEARALVERLAVDNCEVEGVMGDIACWWCSALLLCDEPHAPDCAWEAAREAVAAWKGDEKSG